MGVEMTGGQELKSALNKLKKKINDPEDSMKRIGQVLVDGFQQQFETNGSHWGTPWPEPGPQIKRIRRWQGYGFYHALNVTGNTKKSFTYVPLGGSYMKGVIVGTPLKHADRLNKG